MRVPLKISIVHNCHNCGQIFNLIFVTVLGKVLINLDLFDLFLDA